MVIADIQYYRIPTSMDEWRKGEPVRKTETTEGNNRVLSIKAERSDSTI